MSKFYEEYLRCKVDELKIFNKDPKGEITIVISEKEHIKVTYLSLQQTPSLKDKHHGGEHHH